MTLRHLVIVALAGAISVAQAQHSEIFRFRWTGATLIDYFSGRPGAPNPPHGGPRGAERAEAQAYLDGLADASEGMAWCSQESVSRAELDAQIISHLQALPAGQLDTSAFELILPRLQSSFPCAKRSTPAPRWTGAAFIEHVKQTDEARFNDYQAVLRHHAGKGYLNGLADASSGRAGCPHPRIKPGELDADVIHAMRKLPTTALDDNAATLAIQIMRKKYPCK